LSHVFVKARLVFAIGLLDVLFSYSPPPPSKLPIPLLPTLGNPTIPVYHVTLPPLPPAVLECTESFIYVCGAGTGSVVDHWSAEVGQNCVRAEHSKLCLDSHSNCLGLGQGISVSFGYCDFFGHPIAHFE
jgi:hypothetical protein